jgi:hypothetical protein
MYFYWTSCVSEEEEGGGRRCGGGNALPKLVVFGRGINFFMNFDCN